MFRGVALGMPFEVHGATDRFRELLAGFAPPDEAQRASDVTYRLIDHGGGWSEVHADGESLGFDDSESGPPASLLRDLSARAVSRWEGPVLHGCALTKVDATIVICGASGAGKSTVSAKLACRGWSLLAEDLCALDSAGRIQPFPRPFGLADDALALVGLPPRRFAHHLHKALVTPSALASGYSSEPCLPTTVVILDETAAPSELRPADGLRELFATQGVALHSGQDLPTLGRLATVARWTRTSRSRIDPKRLSLVPEALDTCPSTSAEVGRATVLTIDDQSFVRRDDGTLVHLDTVATQALTRHVLGASTAEIADHLNLTEAQVKEVLAQVS